MVTFANTTSPTPFGSFDSDSVFQTEADNMVTFVKRMLGDDVLSVELTKKEVWACFENSVFEFSSMVNQYQTISQITNFLGVATGTLSGSEQRYPRETLEFLQRQAEPYAHYAGLGGAYDSVSGSITLENGRQDYNLYTELKNTAGDHLSGSAFAVGGRMRIGEIFHFSPQAAYRFFDSTSAVNYLNNEFGFESFTPETIFYVLPVFEDILRAGQMNISQRVRRSNYSYQVVGRNLRIFPTPSGGNAGTKKLWVRVFKTPDPLSPDVPDNTTYGVSNISNIPFGNLIYSRLNDISKQWIRQYTLSQCKEVLGRIRGKYQTIPVPGNDITLDGDTLLEHGRSDQEKLKTEFKEMLESLTYDKIVERDADKSENMLRQLRQVPMPNGWAIWLA